MRFSAGFRALLLVLPLGTLGCGSSAKPTAPDVSTALRTAVEAKAPSFTAVEDGERGHHLWQEEQRDGALPRVPDVYGLDRRRNAATTNTQ